MLCASVGCGRQLAVNNFRERWQIHFPRARFTNQPPHRAVFKGRASMRGGSTAR